MSRVRVSASEVPIDSAGRRMIDLHRFWEARRHGSALPVWPDFDILDMRPWLGRVSLYEGSDAAEFRARLRGSMLSPQAGARKGDLVRSCGPADYGQVVSEQFQATLGEGRPRRHVLELSIAGARYSFDRLALPLAPTDKHPARLFTYIEFNAVRARAFWEAYARSVL